MDDIPILFEDNHIMVVVKPVGMVVQADRTGDLDVVSVLKEMRRTKEGKPGNVFLGLIHRLDRVVGGVMVFAKTSKAASRLAEQVRGRSMDKGYLAVVRGAGLPGGTMEDYLWKDEATNTSKTVEASAPGAKAARLHYSVLAEDKGLSLVEIELETGRSHQIRVQFASRGWPLVGDVRYGKERGGTEGPALWSHRLSFRHPVNKEVMVFEAGPPDAPAWATFASLLPRSGPSQH